MITFTVLEEHAGQRLDVFLLDELYEYFKSQDYGDDLEFLSRSLIQEYIQEGVYRSYEDDEGLIDQSSYTIQEGERFQVDLDSIKNALKIKKRRITGDFKIVPQEGKLNIIYEDDKVLVLNKRAGVVVHPGIKHLKNSLANYVKDYLISKGEFDDRVQKAGVVHRLDKPVSGLIIFAKDLDTQQFLKKQFKERKVKKYYLAKVRKFRDTRLSEGLEMERWYRVEGSIARHVSNRMRRKFHKDRKVKDGRWSITNVYVVKPDEFLINIVTGRNHQIRAVLHSLGYYIVGDSLYGKIEQENDKICLESVMLKISNMDTEVNQWFLCDTIGEEVERIILAHLRGD